MVSDVWFAPVPKTKKEIGGTISRLCEEAGFGKITKGYTAVKLHVGEEGNVTYLGPEYAKAVVSCLKKGGATPYLADCNTLYHRKRWNAVCHLELAQAHGFGIENVGAPTIIADGLIGRDFYEVPVNLKHFKSVKIGLGFKDAQSLFVLSHFKGHENTGFGGALKNIGMGMGSRGGKQMMHSIVKPELDAQKCVVCGICAKYCSAGAIKIGKFTEIDREKCVGCGECVAFCPKHALSVEWTDAEALQERMVEFAYGALLNFGKNAAYMNVVSNITKFCDCMPIKMEKVAKDIGILVSRDPVAIDQACHDLVCKSEGRDIFKELNKVDGRVQLEYAEKLGLGSRKYRLIEI
ncbi:MAG: DUF362 domain-containing protein [Candidatus Thermoplasmatota archaeon]|nr:DUF362 domain-containing protein [Candidatus Thermoplasmatota archaeon]